jgi:hypothetical protein
MSHRYLSVCSLATLGMLLAPLATSCVTSRAAIWTTRRTSCTQTASSLRWPLSSSLMPFCIWRVKLEIAALVIKTSTRLQFAWQGADPPPDTISIWGTYYIAHFRWQLGLCSSVSAGEYLNILGSLGYLASALCYHYEYDPVDGAVVSVERRSTHCCFAIVLYYMYAVC